MAALNPPGWLQNVGATHTAAQLRSYIGAAFGPAVSAGSLVPAGGVQPYLGNKLQVTQSGSPAMSVVVKSGVAWIPGSESGSQGAYGVMNDADFTIAIASNGSGLPRIDSIFFKVQDTQYSGVTDACSLVVVAGTPAGSPVHPAAPNNAIRLADVAVANGAVSITNANITDTRTYLGSNAASSVPDVQVFTGSGTWTKPAAARWLYARAVGGGGAGGGASVGVAGQNSKGGGGGGGAYTEAWIDAASVTATVAVTVGAGGTGVSGGAGNAGAQSSFGPYITAPGGSGGGTTAASATGLGAAGGSGGVAGSITAGTGFASKGGAGQNCFGVVSRTTTGTGGDSVLGGGAVGTSIGSSPASVAGAAGGNYGGGGSGGGTTDTGAANAGGAGAGGLVAVVTIV